MKVFLMFFAVLSLPTAAICQNCDLDSMFTSSNEVEIQGKKTEIGKSIESQIKKIDHVVFSGTSYLISFNDCKLYLPVIERFNHSKYKIGAEYLFVISFVLLENKERYYYVKEIKLIE